MHSHKSVVLQFATIENGRTTYKFISSLTSIQRYIQRQGHWGCYYRLAPSDRRINRLITSVAFVPAQTQSWCIRYASELQVMETHPNHLKIDTLVWEPTAQVELKAMKSMYLVSRKVFGLNTTFPTRVCQCTHWRGQEHQKVHKQRSSSYLTSSHEAQWIKGGTTWSKALTPKFVFGAHALISRLTNSLWARNAKVPTPAPVFPMFHGQCKKRLDRVVSSKNESETWGSLTPIDSRHQAQVLSNIPVALYFHHAEHLWNLALCNSFLQFDRKAASKTSTCPLGTHKHALCINSRISSWTTGQPQVLSPKSDSISVGNMSTVTVSDDDRIFSTGQGCKTQKHKWSASSSHVVLLPVIGS